MQERMHSSERKESEPGGARRPVAGVAGQRDFVDKRSSAVVQGELIDMVNDSARLSQSMALSNVIHAGARQVEEGHRPGPASGAAVQAQHDDGASGGESPVQRPREPNHAGLPDRLKSGIESLSGMSMDHVKVHYNSSRPAQLQAHAYAQGSEIHVEPGQERYLPHEAWHVVQQAQGRVKPTMQLHTGQAVNSDAGLEAEADIMGGKALDRGMARMPPPGHVNVDATPVAVEGIAQLRGNRRPAAYRQFANRTDVPARHHVFNAETGTDGRLSGLHAYKDGALPNNVQVLFTHGSTNGVHIIVWTDNVAVNGIRYCKWSSMFPRDMPEAVVCFLLLRAAGLVEANEAPEVGTGYGTIAVGGSGDTRYPVHSGSRAIHATLAAAFGNAYTPAGHHPLPSLTRGGVAYRINN